MTTDEELMLSFFDDLSGGDQALFLEVMQMMADQPGSILAEAWRAGHEDIEDIYLFMLRRVYFATEEPRRQMH